MAVILTLTNMYVLKTPSIVFLIYLRLIYVFWNISVKTGDFVCHPAIHHMHMHQ